MILPVCAIVISRLKSPDSDTRNSFRNGPCTDLTVPRLQIIKMADEIVNGTEKVDFSSFKGDVIVCCGGFEGRFDLDTVEAFCLTTNTWADLPPMPVQCDSLAAGSYGSAVFIAGGSDR